MLSSLGLVLLILTISIDPSLNNSKCGQLSNGCKLKSYYCNDFKNGQTKCHLYVCDRIDANFQFDQTEMKLIRNCSANNNTEVIQALNRVYFKLSKWSIFDESFDIFNNELFLNSFQTGANQIDFNLFDMASDNYMHDRMIIRYIKGFDIGNFNSGNSSIRIDFHYSKLDFYLNRSLSRSCEDIFNMGININYVFQSFSPCHDCSNDLRFYNCEYKTDICPYYLSSYTRQTYFRFFGIQNTFYKSNYPRFKRISNVYSPNLVLYLDLVDMQNIVLNSDILNEYLFSKIFVLRLFGDIVSIEKGLLKPFISLRQIQFNLPLVRKLMHNGIDWMFDLNSDINIDFKNISDDRCIVINFNNMYEKGVKTHYYQNDIYDYFPDEDFCLYARIPFQQLVSIVPEVAPLEENDCSCTYLWIVRNQRMLFKFCPAVLPESEIILLLNSSKVNECDLEKRLT